MWKWRSDQDSAGIFSTQQPAPNNNCAHVQHSIHHLCQICQCHVAVTPYTCRLSTSLSAGDAVKWRPTSIAEAQSSNQYHPGQSSQQAIAGPVIKCHPGTVSQPPHAFLLPWLPHDVQCKNVAAFGMSPLHALQSPLILHHATIFCLCICAL